MNKGQPTAGAGRPERPPGLQAEMAIAPAVTHTAMPTNEIASIANSLPTKIASTGTAAARISIALFDFSSISCDRTAPARRMVRKKMIV